MTIRNFYTFVIVCGLLVSGVEPTGIAAKNAQADALNHLTFLPLIFRPPQPPVEILASGQASPSSLISDSPTMYWSNCGSGSNSSDGAIMAYSKSQATYQPLFSGLSCPGFLAANADDLFWLNRQLLGALYQFTIYRASRAGGQPVEITSFSAINGSLAVDDEYVYWREYDGTVMRLPQTGNGLPQPAPIPAFVFDGPEAYWVNSNGDLIRSAKDGSQATTLVKGSDLAQLAGRQPSAVYIMEIFPQATEIYFTTFVDNYPGMTSCTDQRTVLMVVPKIGGMFQSVASVAGRARALVAEPYVYFSGNCSHGIIKINTTTQDQTVVAGWPEAASDLSDDAEYIYWTDSTHGWVKRVGK